MTKKIAFLMFFTLGVTVYVSYAHPVEPDPTYYSYFRIKDFLDKPEHKALYEKVLKEFNECCKKLPVSNCNDEPNVSENNNKNIVSDPAAFENYWLHPFKNMLEFHRIAKTVEGWTENENLSLECIEAAKKNRCTEMLLSVNELHSVYNNYYKRSLRGLQAVISNGLPIDTNTPWRPRVINPEDFKQ